MVKNFNGIFLTVLNSHAPIKSRKANKENKLRFNKDVQQCIIQRDRLYTRFKSSGKIFDWIKYKSTRNFCVYYRNVKRSFFAKAARARVKTFWKHTKFCTGLGKSKSTDSPWLRSNSMISKQSVNVINSHFVI